jgi:hypothetical protein
MIIESIIDLQNPADEISVKVAELKILQDEAIALTSWAHINTINRTSLSSKSKGPLRA